MKDGGRPEPKVAIPGAAGDAIAAGLRVMAMHCGPMVMHIHKVKLERGGYIYTVEQSETQPPVKPVTQ